MSVEPGIIDTNILVYAMDADAPQHAISRALLEIARTDSVTFYTTSQILCAFYSIVTNAKRTPKPRTPTEASQAISSLLAFLYVLPVPAQTVEMWLDLLRRHPVTGQNVFDLQIAATMLANGVSTIYAFNVEDFDVFPELTVSPPLES